MLWLSYESWDEIFGGKDANLIFNSFLNTYLRIFNASFPIIKNTLHQRVTLPGLLKELKYPVNAKGNYT
jgi:hypothetical protein